jgi:hypothetical protein
MRIIHGPDTGKKNVVTHFKGAVLEKKSAFMGQFRITPSEQAKIREMLKFYQRDRRQMARGVMEALFYHCDRKEQLVFPLRFVVVDKTKLGD